MNTENTRDTRNYCRKKNGARMPKSDIKPPIPGPIMNPVLIVADKYPNAFALFSNDVVSAIKAVTAGIIHAELTPPSALERNNTHI